MDVSVSVSFFQDELASTIEHAVKAAVDTVLCEITKVVGGKFTEFQMEMAGKEKENESLKLRLEISESELKALRECMNSRRGSRHSKAGDAGESTSSLLWPVASGGSRQLRIQSKTTTQEAQESTAGSFPDSSVRPLLLGSTETGGPETLRNTMSRSDPDLQIQTGKRPTPCPECGKSFIDSGNLKQHRRIHTGEKPYRCTECGKNFSELGNLKQHRRIHTGEKPYRCTECGKSFTHSNSLKIHERAHTGHTRYICDECGKSFSQFEHLKVHRRIHTGEKPYQCPDCGKRFRHSGVLKKHQRIHTGEKPYHCTECGMRFSRVDYLKAHQRLHA
ncbi:UNVERIFIED_CONTAM: hypothetical protein FKN15_028901 [Acipenser sinensis]